VLNVRALRERLRANAEVLAALVAGVGDEQARWRPDSAQWSILEVVNHLADEEVEDFRARLDAVLHHPGAWPPIDPQGWPTSRRYNEREIRASVDRFLAARAESLEWLDRLASPDWSLAYQHPSIGPISAGDLLTSWVAHDHIHIRQINRLHRDWLITSLSDHSPRYAGRW
jgi:hypothetical protein